jgi:hypothetical protein
VQDSVQDSGVIGLGLGELQIDCQGLRVYSYAYVVLVRFCAEAGILLALTVLDQLSHRVEINSWFCIRAAEATEQIHITSAQKL